MEKIILGEVDHRFGSLGSGAIHLLKEIVSNQNEIIDWIRSDVPEGDMLDDFDRMAGFRVEEK